MSGNVTTKHPWYDDRITLLENESVADVPDDDFDEDEDECLVEPYEEKPPGSKTEEGRYESPQKIYRYLDRYVWKQDEAKKAAAVLAYKVFVRNMKCNAFFVGPSGCGKTFIWRMLQEIFPDRIEIVDGSNLTQDGWKGGKKWSNLLESPIFQKWKTSVLVIDEADKFLRPKFSSYGENVSQNIAAEGLKILEGIKVEVRRNELSYKVNTENISFVLLGAFSQKAEEVAEKSRRPGIGFGAEPDTVPAYAKPLTEADLLEYGVLPEFLGRIQNIVNLEPMTTEDYIRFIQSRNGPLQRVGREYQAEIHLTEEKQRKLAEEAFESGLGIRGLENKIRRMVDAELFENDSQRSFAF